MTTTRADRAPTLPSRQVLAELPARVVIFLRAAGAHAGIRAALARGGFTGADHREGWELLARVCAYGSEGPDPADDEPARAAIARIAAWVETHFPRLRAAVDRLHPEAASLFAGIQEPESQEAVVALATWLARVEALDCPSPVGRTLARRGITDALRAELEELVRVAKAAPPVDAHAPVRAAREEELSALYRWFADWSATARAVVGRRDYLIALGIAGRKRKEREEPPHLRPSLQHLTPTE